MRLPINVQGLLTGTLYSAKQAFAESNVFWSHFWRITNVGYLWIQVSSTLANAIMAGPRMAILKMPASF